MSNEQTKDYFGYSQLLSLTLHNLPEAKRWAFLCGVEGFGFDHIEPDFAADEEMQAAWHKVRPSMARGWEAATAGSIGGRKAAQVKAGKDAKPAKNATPPPPFPNMSEPPTLQPSPRFASWLERQGFKFIQDNGRQYKALNEFEFAYLLAYFGGAATTEILHRMDAHPEKINAKSSVFLIARNCLFRAQGCFNSWYEKGFEWLAKAPEIRKLRFSQYNDLRAKYGRANVVAKLAQMNTPKFNANTTTASVLENWLKHSISTEEAPARRLQPYNDSPAAGDAFPAGFDSGFDYCTEAKKILPKYTPNECTK